MNIYSFERKRKDFIWKTLVSKVKPLHALQLGRCLILTGYYIPYTHMNVVKKMQAFIFRSILFVVLRINVIVW